MPNSPPGGEVDVRAITLGFQVGKAAGGECVQALESGECRFRCGAGPGWIQENDVELPAGQRCPLQRVRARDGDVVRVQGADRPFKHRGDTSFTLDQDDAPGSTRGGLEAERPGPGEEVEAPSAFPPRSPAS